MIRPVLALAALALLTPLQAPLAPAAPRPPQTEAWRAGVASAVITPEEPMWMAGYAARTAPAQGTVQDLFAKVLVLEDPAGNRAVLVTTDLLGFPRSLSENTVAALESEYGLAREQIMLTSSHTHCGPVLRESLYVAYDLSPEQIAQVERYTAALRERLVELVGQAIDGLASAQLSWGNGRCSFAVNRRNNSEADFDPANAVGPVDHDVPVLRIDSEEGELLAVVFGYACHNTTLDFNYWCGDYAGYAQADLQERHPGAVAMFYAGCGADQNPIPRRSLDLAQAYGRQLALGVQEVLEGDMRPITGNLAAEFTHLDLAFDTLPSRAEIEQQAQSDNVYYARRARNFLEILDAGGELPQTYPYPIQVWQLGDGPTLVALGGEVVVDFSLRFKHELGEDTTWVAAYANDVMAYIPSLRVLQEGGYEGGGAMVYYGLPTVWAPEVEERIVATVHELVEQTRTAAPQ